MGVYTKCMEMPAGPWACPLFDEYGNCAAVNKADNCCSQAERDDRGFPRWCPLVPVTEPHGRLIDVDGFEKRLQKELQNALPYFTTDTWRNHSKEIVEAIISELNEEPTIIPAEEGET